MPIRTPTLLASAALAAALAACGGAEPPPAQADAPPPPRAAPPVAPSVPPGHIARGTLESVLRQGPPWILRRVPVEEVIRGGNFVGWKILGMPADWGEPQLRTGDVVTRVNGQALEKPDDLFTVWKALATSKEIRIAYERDGKEGEAVIPVAGEPSPELVKALEEGRPSQPQAPPTGRPRGVVVIEGDRPSGGDE
ncbi:MAG TPA: hypothetical protein VLS89_20445 [Candidatus Nanopelagicales bacterium]|nr:hypothetical protein [Candidatus Nanopelagicales bacterium]